MVDDTQTQILYVNNFSDQEFDSIRSKTDSFLCPLTSIIPSQIPSSQPTKNPSSYPSQIPSQQPSNIPSKIPTLMPSLSPSSMPTANPSTYPSQTPSQIPSSLPTIYPTQLQFPSHIPSEIPSSEPSNIVSITIATTNDISRSETPATIINYFELFNISQKLDILFNSTMKKHNTTNLKDNTVFQKNMTSFLKERSHLLIADSTTTVIAVKITNIWLYNGNVSDHCELENTQTTVNTEDGDFIYSSWIRFVVKFNNSGTLNEWNNKLESIIDILVDDLTNFEYFVNDTISLSYCTLQDSLLIGSQTGKSNTNLESVSIILTIVIMSSFIVISLFGYIDATLIRRNEIFSIGAIMAAPTYTLDVISGLCKL